MLSIREKKVLLAVSDALCLAVTAAGVFLGVLAFMSASNDELLVQLGWVVAFGGGLLFCAYLNDCLDVTSIQSPSRYLRRWAISWVIVVGVYLVAFFIFGRPAGAGNQTLSLPRLLPALFAIGSLIVVPTGRWTCRRWLGIGGRLKACIVVGAGGSGQHFVENVAAEHGEWRVCAIVDDDPAKRGMTIAGVKVEGSSSELVELAAKYDVQEIVLAISNGMNREVIDGLLACFERGIDVVPVMVASERTLGRIPINHLGNKWLPTTFWASSTMPLFYRVAKRGMDIALSSILLLLSSPLLLLGAIAIKAGSRGSVIYSQKRMGSHGRLFAIYKLRTMVADAEASGAQWATAGDARITPVGRVLRLSRIDELPQLLNVLNGDMSLIGPRPERPEFVALLEKEIPYYRARLCVRPGLTGWAQIMYRYGNSVDDSKVKLEFDLYYIKNRSLLLDLMIGLRTLKTVLLLRGT